VFVSNERMSINMWWLINDSDGRGGNGSDDSDEGGDWNDSPKKGTKSQRSKRTDSSSDKQNRNRNQNRNAQASGTNNPLQQQQQQHQNIPALDSSFTPAHLLGGISGAEAFGPLQGSLLASSLSLPMHQTNNNVANRLGMGDELMATNNTVGPTIHSGTNQSSYKGTDLQMQPSRTMVPGRQGNEVHTVRPSTRQSNLTRSARTLLSQHGFEDVLESGGDERKRGKLANGLAVNDSPSVQVEVDDPLNAHEITMQFAAYRCAQGENVPQPRKVFFTFQFYNALPTRTERMSLVPGDKGADRNEEQRRVRYQDGVSRPFILTRDNDSTGHHKQPSHAIRFLMDTTKYGPGEGQAFAEYLAFQVCI
jgi:hypothetical protein